MDLSSFKATLKSPETISLTKRITFLVGTLAMFVGSICYMLLSDLGFGNEATWLILATILSMGSAICQFFSSNMKDRPVRRIVLRSVAVALGIGYVLFLHLSTTTDFYKGIMYDKLVLRNVCTIVSLIFAYIGVVAQIANLVLIATIQEE